ncbi:MAG: tetratricopeptide repeat protein [Acidimicrobiales bacterium]
MATETLTFLFTDIEGSTEMLRRSGRASYAAVLADHHSIIRSGIAAQEGKEMGTQGDGFFAVFSSPSACVAAVLETQRALSSHKWPADEHVRVRMGIHSGEAEETASGLVGLEVHRAARVAAVAHGGQVLVSSAAVALVRDSLPEGTSLRDLGSHRLKDLGHPEQLFQLEAEGLRSDFPPLRSLDNPALANNLSAQSSNFVGRGLEVSEVRRLVESSRLVTLTGSGGAGKTRLALQVVAELVDGSGDGVWLVELATVTDPEIVASTINETLGITPQSGRSPLETLLDTLAHQRLLIVLDNCEHLIGACAKIADLILRRCSAVHLVATSREPLGIGGETIYRVPSLSLPTPGDDALDPRRSDAIALFMDRAISQGVEVRLDEHTSPLIASICRRLDGMPLAIELAAARLRSLSLDSLNERLDQRFRLLTGGSRSALPRQQTLRATIDWSYSLLNGPEQSLLRRLSVFAEGFDLEAAEAIGSLGDIDVFEIADLLGSLVDKNLVVMEPTAGTTRYHLLETIRQFSAERLVEFDEREALTVGDAHCQHYLAFAELASPHLTGPEQGRWFERLDADEANLRRALEYAVGDRDGTNRVLRFAVALRRYWWVRSRYQDMGVVEPVLERPEARAEPGLMVEALVCVAFAAGDIDIRRARDLGEQALEIARGLDDERLLVDSLSGLSAISYFAGDFESGYALGQESVERARALGNDVSLGESLVRWLLSLSVIDPDRYDEELTEAIACADRSGDQFVTLILENNAGVHALDVGNLPAARSHCERALQVAASIGANISNPIGNLGTVMREEGDAEGARTSYEEAYRIVRRTGNRRGIAHIIMGFALPAVDASDWHRGTVLHGAAETFLESTGEPWQKLAARFREASLAEARAHLGDDEFRIAFAAGSRLSIEEASDLAIGRAR